MKKLLILFSFSFILLFSTLSFAQIPGMVNYNEEDGLNSSYTYGLVQDKNGYIWIGSDNGLFRFDGKEFKQFSSKNGLKNIEALYSYPLPNGEIFIATFLNDFAYLKNENIINSTINTELKKIKFKYNPDFAIDGNTLYMFSGTNPDNIYVYLNEKVTIIPLEIKKKSPDLRYTFAFDPHSRLLYFYDDSQGRNLKAYHIDTKKETTCDLYVEKGTVIFKNKNFFIYRNKKSIDIYELQNQFIFKKIASYQIQKNVYRVVIDQNFRVWACLEKGGVLYFKQSLKDGGNLSNPVKIMDQYIIHDVLVDKDNNVWFSTRNNGLFFITDRFLKNYFHLPVRNNSSYIKAIAKNDKGIFLGYDEAKSGIYRNKTITDLVFEKNFKIEHKGIFSEGNTVIFGLTKRVVQYNTETGEKHFLKEFVLKNILPYTPGSVLLCTSAGLTSYNYRTRKYEDLLTNEKVYTALPFAQDSLFAGTFKDLYKLNTATKKKTLFLEGYYFTDIKKLAPNLYAGATNQNGIILFNNSGILKTITESNGLPTSQIKKLEIENKNTLWASTSSGLCRIRISERTIEIDNFTQTDGLPSSVVTGCLISGDTIYAGTSKGLGILSIKDLLSQKKFINKKVIINSVKIGGKEIFDFRQPLKGQSSDNNVTFHVSFPDFTSQGNISFRYRLEGASDSWQISSSPKIIFNALPPGKYVLKIFGLGYNGKRSYTSTDVPFEIVPKFWQTWWFKLMIISLGAAALFILIHTYFQKKRNKKLETLYYEKKIAELELQAIKAQINPHFIYNCLNSIQFLLYKKNYQETENYLEIFAHMIRKTLHYSEKTFMPIREETEYLSLYLNMEKLRLKDAFDYTITISDRVNENWIVPSLLIQPFVENAIKHGISGLKERKGKIQILFDHTETSLCVIIEDNGVGIGNGNQVKADSFGVKLSQKRIETFRQLFETYIQLEIYDLQEKEQRPGTQIKLYIKPYENKNTNMHH
ncbi:sensor histidine kinase [Chryseobacterium angstadtii]|uniref:sensor histidine kinase n=1 Tax=Chryseobacterium angstadtii TaxID=558151 RepID=UPI00065AE68B|nr:histidine kinase [Chryseobacterium angstadtii]